MRTTKVAPGDQLAEIAIIASHRTLGGVAMLGVVEDAGANAGISAGKTVLVPPFDPCGECDVCRRGGAAVCPHRGRQDAPDGVTHAIAAGRYLVPLEDGLALPSPAAAAVPGDVALAYTLYARTGPAPRDPVVIVGASPVARFLVEILIAKGITPIVVADPAHAAWCAWLGTKQVATVRDAAEVTAAIAAQGATARAPRVIAASADAVVAAAELTGPRSTFTVLAPVASLPGLLADREVTVIPVAGPHPDLIVEVAAMCTRGEIDLAGGTAASENTEMRAVVVARSR